jgi:hypothetical protein
VLVERLAQQRVGLVLLVLVMVAMAVTLSLVLSLLRVAVEAVREIHATA